MHYELTIAVRVATGVLLGLAIIAGYKILVRRAIRKIEKEAERIARQVFEKYMP